MKPFVLSLFSLAIVASGAAGEIELLRVELASSSGTPIAEYALDLAALKSFNHDPLGLAASWQWSPTSVGPVRIAEKPPRDRRTRVLQAFAAGVRVQDASPAPGAALEVSLSVERLDTAPAGGNYLNDVRVSHMPLVLSPDTMRSRFLAEAVFDVQLSEAGAVEKLRLVHETAAEYTLNAAGALSLARFRRTDGGSFAPDDRVRIKVSNSFDEEGTESSQADIMPVQ